MVIFPAIAQPLVRKVLNNDSVAFGFWGSSLVCLSGLVGKWTGKKDRDEHDTWEEVKVPENLGFLKDMSVLMSIIMIIVYIVTGLAAGREMVSELSGGTNWILHIVLQALIFVAGIQILLQGVRMFLGEIVPAFKGISEKLVPGARPALDIPIFYAAGPVATTIGFLFAVIGGLVGTFVTVQLGVVVLPGVIGLFFMGGAAGVFGDKLGGKRGAVVAGAFLGFVFTVMPAIFYNFVDVTRYGIEGLWFASTDAIIVSVLVRAVGAIFGMGA